jgi:predicted enzyme involved in methoxymalonyl-ACP biosynthesis
MRVAARFGDFGLPGVAILAPERDAWHLESFLMSCRVIGKSVETALLARIGEDARAAGASTLSAEFIDSGRNQVASTFLSQHGFAAGPNGRWLRSLGQPGPEWPAWISPVALDPAGAARHNREGQPREGQPHG